MQYHSSPSPRLGLCQRSARPSPRRSWDGRRRAQSASRGSIKHEQPEQRDQQAWACQRESVPAARVRERSAVLYDALPARSTWGAVLCTAPSEVPLALQVQQVRSYGTYSSYYSDVLYGLDVRYGTVRQDHLRAKVPSTVSSLYLYSTVPTTLIAQSMPRYLLSRYLFQLSNPGQGKAKQSTT